MKQLPPDLGQLDADELAVQSAARDERLTPLFRMWPRLGRAELRELRRLYTERVRLARYIGRLRRERVSPRSSRRERR
jgi:hypothetical protein